MLISNRSWLKDDSSSGSAVQSDASSFSPFITSIKSKLIQDEHSERNYTPPELISYPACVIHRVNSALLPTCVFLPRMQLSSLTLSIINLISALSVKLKLHSYPSSITQWSNKMHPVTFTILPMMQWRPMTDRFTVVRSETCVESPMIVSLDI